MLVLSVHRGSDVVKAHPGQARACEIAWEVSPHAGSLCLCCCSSACCKSIPLRLPTCRAPEPALAVILLLLVRLLLVIVIRILRALLLLLLLAYTHSARLLLLALHPKVEPGAAIGVHAAWLVLLLLLLLIAL